MFSWPMITGALEGGSRYNFTSVPQIPATSIFNKAPSCGISGIGNSRISVLPGATLTAACTRSNIVFLLLGAWSREFLNNQAPKRRNTILERVQAAVRVLLGAWSREFLNNLAGKRIRRAWHESRERGAIVGASAPGLWLQRRGVGCDRDHILMG